MKNRKCDWYVHWLLLYIFLLFARFVDYISNFCCIVEQFFRYTYNFFLCAVLWIFNVNYKKNMKKCTEKKRTNGVSISELFCFWKCGYEVFFSIFFRFIGSSIWNMCILCNLFACLVKWFCFCLIIFLLLLLFRAFSLIEHHITTMWKLCGTAIGKIKWKTVKHR